MLGEMAGFLRGWMSRSSARDPGVAAENVEAAGNAGAHRSECSVRHGSHDIGDARLRPADDSTLFGRWLTRRDGDAFAELARRHAPVAYDLAARTLGDRQAAEDMVQEALLDLALERTRKPVEVGIAAWLVRFSVCRAKNRRVSESSRSRRERTVGQRRPEVVMPDNSVELADELENVLAHAQDEERLILAMRYLHDWDYEQIAASLEISEGAARVRVHRALSQVRGRLASSRPGDEPRITAALAGLPLLRLPPSRLEGAITDVLTKARAELGVTSTGVGAQTAAWSRVARLAIELAALLAVVGAGAAAPARLEQAAGCDGGAAALGVESAVAAAPEFEGGGRDVLRDGDSTLGTPRPRDWDDGSLRRLARDERELRTRPAPATAGPDRRTGATSPGDAGREPPHGAGIVPLELPNTSRPNSREACAARCDSASSEGERAGVLGSSSVAARTTAPASADSPASPSSAGAAADATSTDRDPASARKLAERPSRLVDALPPEDRAVLAEAVDAVERVVRGELGELADLSGDPDALRVARRRAAREYRRLRREMRAAALDGDTARITTAAKRAYKISTLNQVLDLLVEALRVRPTSFGQVRWPDGVDVRLALEDVLRVFGPAPDDGAPAGPGAEPSATETALPEQIDPDRLPDGLGW